MKASSRSAAVNLNRKPLLARDRQRTFWAYFLNVRPPARLTLDFDAHNWPTVML